MTILRSSMSVTASGSYGGLSSTRTLMPSATLSAATLTLVTNNRTIAELPIFTIRAFLEAVYSWTAPIKDVSIGRLAERRRSRV